MALSRKQEQEVFLFVGKIKITCKVLYLDSQRVRLGWDAPQEVKILRSEVYDTLQHLGDGGESVAIPSPRT